MNSLKILLLILAATLAYKNAVSQNVSMNILTQNSGMISKVETRFVEVTVCNTSSTIAVPVYKLRPQISVPISIIHIPDTGHILPKGWKFISITDGVIRLSNGTDQIPINDCRTILIAVKGIAIGGPLTISGNMLFSNGLAPGSASGSATTSDNSADNASTSTCEVTK